MLLLRFSQLIRLRVASADIEHQREENSSLGRAGPCARGDRWNRPTLYGVIDCLFTGIASYTMKGMMFFTELSGRAQTELVSVHITGQPVAAVEGSVVALVAIDNDSTLFSCYDSAYLLVTAYSSHIMDMIFLVLPKKVRRRILMLEFVNECIGACHPCRTDAGETSSPCFTDSSSNPPTLRYEMFVLKQVEAVDKS